MTYLEILKKFDKAIVTESQKLQDIYDNLVKDGRASNQFCNEEETEDTKKPEEGADENSECHGESEEDDKKKQACEFTEADDDKADDNAEDNGSKKASGGLVSAEQFFGTDDDTADQEQTDQTDTADSADATDDSKDREPDEANESSAEQRAALSASDLFEDEDDDKDVPTDNPEPPKDDDGDNKNTQPEAKPEDDGAEDKKPADECEDQKRKSAQDWLNEKDGDTEAGDTKCPKCGNDPCTCDDDEEETETEQLQESIKNISAFVKANKKLFVG